MLNNENAVCQHSLLPILQHQRHQVHLWDKRQLLVPNLIDGSIMFTDLIEKECEEERRVKKKKATMMSAQWFLQKVPVFLLSALFTFTLTKTRNWFSFSLFLRVWQIGPALNWTLRIFVFFFYKWGSSFAIISVCFLRSRKKRKNNHYGTIGSLLCVWGY